MINESTPLDEGVAQQQPQHSPTTSIEGEDMVTSSTPTTSTMSGKVVRVIGAVQGTTAALSIFEERRRRVLEAVGATIQWITEVHYEGPPDDTSDVVPIICGDVLNSGGSGDQAPRRSAPVSGGERLATTHIGTIRSEPSTVFGNEDPLVWSSRRNGTAQCIVDVPSSTPIIFATNAVADRISALRARNARAQAYSQQQQEVDAAVENGITKKEEAMEEEPPCKLPLVMFTRAVLSVPPKSPISSTSSSTFCLGRCTTRVGNIRDLVGKIAEAKINIIGSDLSAALAHCHALETMLAEGGGGGVVEIPQQGGEEEDDDEDGDGVYNPYKLDVDREGNLVDAAVPSRPSGGGGQQQGSSPPPRVESRFGERQEDEGLGTPSDSEVTITSTVTEADRFDREHIVGFAYVSFTFADLGPAVGPIVSVQPDTILSDTTAKLLVGPPHRNTPLSPAPIPTASQQQQQQRQLKKVAPPAPFALPVSLFPPTASMKLGAMNGKGFAASEATTSLKWSKTPLTVPYGCMPLVDLYQTLSIIYNKLLDPSIAAASLNTDADIIATKISAQAATVKIYKPLMKQLQAQDVSCGRDPLTGQYRWELVRQLSLLRFILGEVNVLPLLSLLICCRGLEHVDLDMNCLKVTTAKRLVECLRSHPRLQSVSLRSNEFYESAGEQLLRLLKLNRRIVVFNLDGNFFTPALSTRIGRALAANVSDFQADATNFLSNDFAYMDTDVVSGGAGPGCSGLFTLIPEESIQQVLQMWAIIACAPNEESLGGYEPPSITSKLGNTKATTADSSAPPVASDLASARLGIPTVAMAPLFAQAMRTLQIELSTTESEDRVISGVFKDFGGAGVAANVISGEEGLLKENLLPTIAFRPASSSNRNPSARAVMAGMDVAAPNMEASFSRSYSKMLCTGLRTIMRAVTAPDGSLDEEITSEAWREGMDSLRALGDTHFRMGVRPSHYIAANRAFLSWMQAVMSVAVSTSTVLGDEKNGGGQLGTFTPASRAAWAQVLAFLCRVCLSGCPIGQQLLPPSTR